MALAFRGISDFISRFQSNLPSISLDAAARLARVEAAVSEQSRALEAAQVAAQKSRLRYNLYTAEMKEPVRALQSSQMEQAQVLTKIATEISAIKDQARGHEQVLALQQDLVARLVDVVQKRSKDDPYHRPSRGTGHEVVEQSPNLVPPPDPWTYRGDPG